MFGWLLIPMLLLGLGALLLGWRPQNAGEPRRTPKEILRERYARGEISREEYEQVREDIT
jgi:putative membrane protein